jgi:ATP-dependent helicase HrpA
MERALDTTRKILEFRTALEKGPARYPGMEKDIARLLSPEFPKNIPFEKFERIPRFLKAIQVRAERAALRPAQDAQKSAQLDVFLDWEKKVPGSQTEIFRWLLEELRVSIFAQELGTAETVSIPKLQRFLEPTGQAPARRAGGLFPVGNLLRLGAGPG